MRRRSLLLLGCALPLRAQEFTAELWRSIASIYRRTLEHPFLRGLTDGSLPRDRFQFYLIQDGLYLRAFSRALNTLAAKAPKEEWALTLSQHAIDAIRAERELHETILRSYGLTAADAARATMAPANAAYTNHLLASVHRLSFVEGLAAMLPCYWIYWEVGKHLVKRGSKDPSYQRWIDQYSGDAYAASVRQALAIMNDAAREASPAQLASARALFERSARYEWMFWEMAWRREQWPPEE
jgi:thiaminase (transcriptional activator TenA)